MYPEKMVVVPMSVLAVENLIKNLEVAKKKVASNHGLYRVWRTNPDETGFVVEITFSGPPKN